VDNNLSEPIVKKETGQRILFDAKPTSVVKVKIWNWKTIFSDTLTKAGEITIPLDSISNLSRKFKVNLKDGNTAIGTFTYIIQ